MLMQHNATASLEFHAGTPPSLALAGILPAFEGKVRPSQRSPALVATGSPNISGFTLTELLVTVAVVAILVTVGIPTFIDLVKNNRISNQASEFITSLMLARSEAVRRGSIVCVKRKGTTAGNWSAGWDVFPEASGETNCATIASTIQTYDPLPGDQTLTVGNPFQTYMRYNGLGVAVDASGVPVSSADFKLCRGTTANDIANSRLITISATGHPSTKASTTGSPTPPTTCP